MLILDVGGHDKPYKGSTHCIDVLPKSHDDSRVYVQQDVCSAWPFKDKEFDQVYCSNVLEDVKDPMLVIREMERVGKSGIIIVPSPFLECKKGVDIWYGNEQYAGFVHHRWIIFPQKDKIVFMQKTPIVTVIDYVGEKKGPNFIRLEWKENIPAEEMVYADWNEWNKKLLQYFHNS